MAGCAEPRQRGEEKKKKVIVVDDDPIIRMTLASELERIGEFERVGQAPDGEEALRLVTHYRPELMVLDLELPKLDGLSVLERLRSQGSRLAILVLSAKDERVMGTRVRAAGANGFVSKRRDVRATYRGASTTRILPIVC